MTKKKGVHKGENFPPCTEEDAFPSSVSFPFYIFSILFYLHRRLFVFVYAVSCLFFLPQLVFVLFFAFYLSGGYKGVYPLIAVYRIDPHVASQHQMRMKN